MVTGRTSPRTWGGRIDGTNLSKKWYFRFDRVPLDEVRRRIATLKPLNYDLRGRLVYVTARRVLLTWTISPMGDDTLRPFYLTEPEWRFKQEWESIHDRDAIWQFALEINPHLDRLLAS